MVIIRRTEPGAWRDKYEYVCGSSVEVDWRVFSVNGVCWSKTRLLQAPACSTDCSICLALDGSELECIPLMPSLDEQWECVGKWAEDLAKDCILPDGTIMKQVTFLGRAL